MQLEDCNLTIVGLGLIGGSLALGLRDSCRRLVGVDSSLDVCSWAFDHGYIDEATQDLAGGLADCDLCILAVPVIAIVDILDRLGADLPSPRVVLDVGSTKMQVLEAMDRLPPDVQGVGGHPFSGKETSGPSAADPTLFQARRFALIPSATASPEAVHLAQQVVGALGARAWITDADAHDKRVACSSQLPFLLADTLMSVGCERASDDPQFWDAVASGFLDTTRLAASNTDMLRDTLLSNRTQVLEAVEEAVHWLQAFSDRLTKEDVSWIDNQLSEMRRVRQSLAAPAAHISAPDESHNLWPGP